MTAEYECPKCGGEVHVDVGYAAGVGVVDYAVCLACDWRWDEGEGTDFPLSDEPGEKLK